jgi:predicted dehydrogenase
LSIQDLLSRREFIQSSSQTLATLAALQAVAAACRAEVVKEPVRMGLIGCGSIMTFHIKNLIERHAPVVITHLCDVDPAQIDKAGSLVSKLQKSTPKICAHYEDLLDDQTVEAVLIATPHHWHMPIALAAIQAGKDIYLEKPASHVFHEGQLLIEAAKKHGRIVQHGSQMRSSPVTALAGKLLADGILGEVKIAKAWSVQQRDVPPVAADGDPPPGVDYDRWLGPAPKRPFNANRFHNKWRAFPEYGNGTIGDDGAHDLDIARWALGEKTHPVRVTAHASSIAYHDPEFPDNMNVAYQYADNKVLLYEDRQFTPYGLDGFDSGNAFYGSEGYMTFSRRGYFQVYLGPKAIKGPGVPPAIRGPNWRGYNEHMDNFLECVRTRKTTNADSETAHISCGLVHLANIAARTEQVLHFDPQREVILNNPAASELLTKTYRSPYQLPTV